MTFPLKSRASQKFRANHPYQHQMFSSLVKGAKQTKTKFMFQREEDEINKEFSNMIQNQQNVLLRPADLTFNQPRKVSPDPKRVSWKNILCEERTIPEEEKHLPSLWTGQTCPRTWPDLILQTCYSPSKASEGNHVTDVQDVSQTAYCTESADTRTLLSDNRDSPLPDLLRQSRLQPARLGGHLPDLLLLTNRISQQGFPFSQDNLYESSSPESASPESSPSESSSPESSSPEPSSPESSEIFCKTKDHSCMKLSFFLDCDPCIERQR